MLAPLPTRDHFVWNATGRGLCRHPMTKLMRVEFENPSVARFQAETLESRFANYLAIVRGSAAEGVIDCLLR
jgi:hypothetical protein